MGDSNSWVVFLMGGLFIAVIGLALIAACIVLYIKYFSEKDNQSERRLKEWSSSGQVSTIFADTVIDVNTRKSDNRFQAVFIVVSVLLLSTAGAIATIDNDCWALPWSAGAILGLVIGFVASGIYIMAYRVVMYMQGRRN